MFFGWGYLVGDPCSISDHSPKPGGKKPKTTTTRKNKRQKKTTAQEQLCSAAAQLLSAAREEEGSPAGGKLRRAARQLQEAAVGGLFVWRRFALPFVGVHGATMGGGGRLARFELCFPQAVYCWVLSPLKRTGRMLPDRQAVCSPVCAFTCLPVKIILSPGFRRCQFSCLCFLFGLPPVCASGWFGRAR